ncbi:MAG TPA: ethanolamine utilization protein EutJ [Anaerolineae bacterium]|nr:ethanolamine utilization protein EutJ [Anaerolineae bacterium]HQJ52143.1 ethanolamine utilization protein EutJ [Anaerolineae bacterium]
MAKAASKPLVNPRLPEILAAADRVVTTGKDGPVGKHKGVFHVGVDLGTAYTVVMVLNEDHVPVAGAWRYAEVVRDGVVVDYLGAIQLVRELKAQVEQRLGAKLVSAASAYPPGVALAEVRATGHVLEGAGLECSKLVDEATAAATLLQIDKGVVVDVGGGTTKLAVVRGGKVIYTADEPTGGTHFSLVIAGALHIPYMEAEQRKTNRRHQAELFPIIRPVMEKVGTIVARHIGTYKVDTIYLVGGTARYPDIASVIEEVTGIKTVIPGDPLFVTPIGIAMHN